MNGGTFDPQAFLRTLTTWPFLQEPIWRWFIFLLILALFANVQKGMLRHMRSVV